MNTNRKQEVLGIIKDINVGLRDVGYPIIWFTVESLNGHSLQVIKDIPKFIKETDCYKLSDLNGKPCVMLEDGCVSDFVRIFKG